MLERAGLVGAGALHEESADGNRQRSLTSQPFRLLFTRRVPELARVAPRAIRIEFAEVRWFWVLELESRHICVNLSYIYRMILKV